MLSKAHASHAIRVCYLLFCVPCIFLCVCSASLRSLQLFLERLLGALARAFFGALLSLFSSCLALSLAPSLEPDFSLFSCFSSSCLSLSLSPSLKPFLLALILFTIHLEYRWITNTHFELGFLSTSEMSTVLSTKESNHSNIHCHVQKMRRMRRCHAVRFMCKK